MKILIIEDDRETAQTLRDELKNRYTTELAYTFSEADHLIQTNTYDIVILDLSLPDGKGETICHNLRQMGVTTPVLILTAESDIKTKVDMLDLGADDYVLKPFSLKELQARIRALLRRENNNQKTEILSVEDLIVNTLDRTVTRQNIPIKLRRKEFDILEFLLRNRGKLMKREVILEHLWSNPYDSSSNITDVYIKYLRDKIDRPFDKKIIKTVHGIGYKIDA